MSTNAQHHRQNERCTLLPVTQFEPVSPPVAPVRVIRSMASDCVVQVMLVPRLFTSGRAAQVRPPAQFVVTNLPLTHCAKAVPMHAFSPLSQSELAVRVWNLALRACASWAFCSWRLFPLFPPVEGRVETGGTEGQSFDGVSLLVSLPPLLLLLLLSLFPPLFPPLLFPFPLFPFPFPLFPPLFPLFPLPAPPLLMMTETVSYEITWYDTTIDTHPTPGSCTIVFNC